MSTVAFELDYGLLLSFIFHRPIFGFLYLIILSCPSYPMAASLPLVNSA
jgi:hypothetical protein